MELNLPLPSEENPDFVLTITPEHIRLLEEKRKKELAAIRAKR